MKLLDARVNGNPRQVTTKYGEKCVLDVWTADGEFTIWRPAGDSEVMGRMNGERVSIAIDSKGKASLVEHCSTAPQQAARSQQMGFTAEAAPETTRSAEIADYIQRLGKLYGHCLSTAANMPTAIELEAPQVKDVANTIFLQTVRHFDL
jgi:hypothetical protein